MANKDDYILFDCPGQVELFTHHDSLKRIFKKLEKLDYRVCRHLLSHLQLVVVNLVDSYCCTDPALYVSAVLLCLKTMLQMEFPFINVLTKIDLLSQYGPIGGAVQGYC
jgi:GPN-loop GTPase